MGTTIEGQVQAETSEIEADNAALSASLTEIAKQVAAAMPAVGTVVTQADMDRLDNARTALDGIAATAAGMVTPAATPTPTPTPTDTPPAAAGP